MQEQSFIKAISSITDIENMLSGYNSKNYITIEIDIEKMVSINNFFIQIYETLGCPEDFGKNMNAFWDTIKDTQFWVKKPAIFIIKNYSKVPNNNFKVRELISDILIELTTFDNQKYYSFIVK